MLQILEKLCLGGRLSMTSAWASGSGPLVPSDCGELSFRARSPYFQPGLLPTWSAEEGSVWFPVPELDLKFLTNPLSTALRSPGHFLFDLKSSEISGRSMLRICDHRLLVWWWRESGKRRWSTWWWGLRSAWCLWGTRRTRRSLRRGSCSSCGSRSLGLWWRRC